MSIAARVGRWGIIVGSMVLTTSTVWAQTGGQDCTALVQGGSYSARFAGFGSFGAAGLLPNAGVNLWQFGPQGRLTGLLTLIIGAFGPARDLDFLPGSTYALSWVPGGRLCTGVAHVTTAATGPVSFQLTVSPDGERIEAMHIDAGLNLNMTLERRRNGPACTNSTIGDTYTYSAQAFVVPPPGVPTPPANQRLNGFVTLGFSGAIRFDAQRQSLVTGAPAGAGHVEGADLTSLNGMNVPRTYVGWYTVARDCIAQVVIVDDIGNPPIHTEALVVDGGRTLHVANLDRGSVVSFDAVRVPDFDLNVHLRMESLAGVPLDGTFVVSQPALGSVDAPATVALDQKQSFTVSAPHAVGACTFVRFVNPASGVSTASRTLSGSLNASETRIAQYRCP